MFTNEATNGVSENEELNEEIEQEIDEFEEQPEERPKSPRELAMEEVVKSRRENLIKDGFELDLEEEEEETEQEVKPKKKIVAKVDGVEEELTQEELDKRLREYQKHKAADKRLEEAAAKMKELEKLEATLKSKSVEHEKESDKEDDIDISSLDGYDAVFEEFADTIRDGNDEDAAGAVKKFTKALIKMIPKSGSANVDEQVRQELERVRKEEEEKLLAEQQEVLDKEVETAKDSFNKEFKKDLEQEKDFYNLAVMEDNKLMNDPEWSNKPLVERFSQAGKNARKWFTGKSINDKTKNEKRNLKPVQQKSGMARLKGDTDDSPMTPSDIIKEMRKGRGQAI